MPERKTAKIYYDSVLHSFAGITPEIFSQLEKTFPNIDINHELGKMSLWLESERGSKRKGNLRFISSWLERAYRVLPKPKKEEEESPVKITDALEEMFNTYWSLYDNIFQELSV